jgi:hypothetical protein
MVSLRVPKDFYQIAEFGNVTLYLDNSSSSVHIQQLVVSGKLNVLSKIDSTLEISQQLFLQIILLFLLLYPNLDQLIAQFHFPKN